MFKRLILPLLALGGSPAVSQTAAGSPLLVQNDIPIRLMVLNEVSTRTVKAGDRFMLRVDQPLIVAGATIIPIGATAWGEVLSAEKSGRAGKAGKLSARLLSVELAGAQIPISGEAANAGASGTGQMTLGAMGLGPLALLARGNNARLKAGDILTAYFRADMLFDRVTSTLSEANPPRPLISPGSPQPLASARARRGSPASEGPQPRR